MAIATKLCEVGTDGLGDGDGGLGGGLGAGDGGGGEGGRGGGFGGFGAGGGAGNDVQRLRRTIAFTSRWSDTSAAGSGANAARSRS